MQSTRKERLLRVYTQHEKQILDCIKEVEKATAVRVIFTETNVSEKELVHDFSAPGDIYKNFVKIQAATLDEFRRDLADIQDQIARTKNEPDEH